MDKFLVTDGTNGVREVQSQEDLQKLIESAEQPERIRIWIFSSNEWISYAAFAKQFPAFNKKDKPAIIVANAATVTKKGSHWLKKFVFITGATAGTFLVFNFTKIKWEKADPVNINAARPANVPVMDIDSLIWEIEGTRGQSLDRSTKNNLRLRNTWPDRILLQLVADKETSSSGSRFFNVALSIDNTTGFNLDNAVVKFQVWKNNKVNTTDTLRISNIRFDKLSKRQLNGTYRGDSISVTFESIKAKAFNFCYSEAAKNNAGNYNDRWFCREENK